ncbi:MAG: lipid-A-disaccharide synthase, partial [Desulfobacteraceae bacterium]|nr:lipid-A-disaccharide synthase [Desulfobacteraceae bacterium]
KAMVKKSPHLRFFGMGGVELVKNGVEVLFDAQKIAVVGVVEVLTHLIDIIRAQRILRKEMAERRPDLLILIDFPDFNLMLAKKAKKLGIPVFYYISPQVWAWRSGRVKTIAKRVDKIGVILPFEEQYYQERGVSAHYVGHPLLDVVKVHLDRNKFCAKYSLDSNKKIVGILPGSRKREVAALLPTFLESASKLQEQSSDELIFLLPLASTLSRA